MAQVGDSGTAPTPLSTNTPMQPFGQIVLFGSAPKGTKTSPDIGSTATEWSPGVVAQSPRVFTLDGFAARTQRWPEGGLSNRLIRPAARVNLDMVFAFVVGAIDPNRRGDSRISPRLIFCSRGIAYVQSDGPGLRRHRRPSRTSCSGEVTDSHIRPGLQ